VARDARGTSAGIRRTHELLSAIDDGIATAIYENQAIRDRGRGATATAAHGEQLAGIEQCRAPIRTHFATSVKA